MNLDNQMTIIEWQGLDEDTWAEIMSFELLNYMGF